MAHLGDQVVERRLAERRGHFAPQLDGQGRTICLPCCCGCCVCCVAVAVAVADVAVVVYCVCVFVYVGVLCALVYVCLIVVLWTGGAYATRRADTVLSS